MSKKLARHEVPAAVSFWDGDRWFPFFETEQADILGPGHQDPMAFVYAVQAYDEHLTSEQAEAHDPGDVSHRWAIVTEDDGEGYVQLCKAHDEGSVPVTTIWGVR